MVIKITLALILGLILGLERETVNKPAGLRDIILVILGTLMFTMLNDPQNRVIANIITGIGFLGGGVIIKNNDNVEGVTTAVVLWLSVAIGMAIGLNRLKEAICCGVISIAVLYSKFLYRRFLK